jgi:hypothetical protein
MDFQKFSRMNLSRCTSEGGFGMKLDHWTLSDWFRAFMVEAGEAANVAKKLNRCRDGMPTP